MTSPLHFEQPWKVRDRFLDLHSRWMTLIGEHLQDSQGNLLEYWRIEKADSVIVLPIQEDSPAAPKGKHILLPAPSYRPGIGQVTLDLPGGRLMQGQTPEEGAIAILKRELGIEADAIVQLKPLNVKGWAINSSFSDQKLYGFVAHIQGEVASSNLIAQTYPASPVGVHQLLQELSCLQCRAVLLEWVMLL